MTSALDLTHDCNLQINLGWNVTNTNIKLRSSAIIFNNEGHATDAIQFQNPCGCGGGVTHATIGDEKAEFVEDLSIDLSKLDPNIRAIVIVISHYAKESFSAVDMLHVQVNEKQSQKDLMQFYFNPSGPYNALALCTLYRHIVANEEDVPKWTLETVMERIQGHTLMELVPQIQDTILSNKVIPHLLGFDSIRFYTAPVLPKGEMYTIGCPLIDVKSPTNIDLDIEWAMNDNEEKLHLDAACLAFDIKGKMSEAVYYNRPESQDKSITHHGDELSPEVGLHCERLTISLTSVDPKIRLLVFTLNCYALTSLTKVKHMYVTVTDKDRARTVLSNHVPSEDLTQSAIMLVALFRDGSDSWVIDTINQGCHGKSYDEIMPAIRPHVRRLIQLIKAPWDADDTSPDCLACKRPFSLVRRRHHCRGCGHIYCGECSSKKKSVPKWGYTNPVRVCDTCFLNC
jgi:stress response protein SCP2